MTTLAAVDPFAHFGPENVFTVTGGHRVVAGQYMEPMQRIEYCLVEHAPQELIDSPDAMTVLSAWARTEFPDCTKLLLRLPELDMQLDGFEDFLYLIQLDRESVRHPDEDLVQVRPATPADRERVLEFLVEAYDDGLEMRTDPVPDGAGLLQARQVLADPNHRSLVAVHDGEIIGQITVLLDQMDDVTGLRFVELADILVERKHELRRPAESALRTGAWQIAKTEGMPLLSHIVVREKTCHCAGVEQVILDRVQGWGWRFVHKYQRLVLIDQ